VRPPGPVLFGGRGLFHFSVSSLRAAGTCTDRQQPPTHKREARRARRTRPLRPGRPAARPPAAAGPADREREAAASMKKVAYVVGQLVGLTISLALILAVLGLLLAGLDHSLDLIWGLFS